MMYYDVTLSNPMTKVGQVLTVEADTGDNAAQAAQDQCGGLGMRVHSVVASPQEKLLAKGLITLQPNRPVAEMPINLHGREPVRRDFAGEAIRAAGGNPVGEEAALKEAADVKLAAENAALKALLEAVDERLAALETKRLPGRPKKTAA